MTFRAIGGEAYEQSRSSESVERFPFSFRKRAWVSVRSITRPFSLPPGNRCQPTSNFQPLPYLPQRMTWTLLIILLAAAAVMLVLEFRGLPTTLTLKMKGDLKRESRWLVQYGQSACTPVVAIVVWQLDPRGWRAGWTVGGVVAIAALAAMVLKRLLGRVRPGREGAGRFLGPTWKHSNHRESFPSSHSACAAALSGILALMYPQAAITFWALAVGCAALRWLLDAHWPSDVLAGLVLGLAIAQLAWSWGPLM